MRYFILLVLVFFVGCKRAAPSEVSGQAAEKKSLPDSAKKSAPPEPKIALPAPRPWQADKNLLGELDTPTQINGFLLRPPKGYTPIRAKVAPNESIDWLSPARADFHKTHLMISIMDPSDPSNPKLTVDGALNQNLDLLRTLCESWHQSAFERGNVNGIPFTRVHFRGTYKLQKSMYMQGYSYVARDGNRLIGLSAIEDTSSEQQNFLAAAEAGLLTFQRK
jgi:hypothetical protein